MSDMTERDRVTQGLRYMNQYFSTNESMDMEAGPLGINRVEVTLDEVFYAEAVVHENLQVLRDHIERLEGRRLDAPGVFDAPALRDPADDR